MLFHVCLIAITPPRLLRPLPPFFRPTCFPRESTSRRGRPAPSMPAKLLLERAVSSNPRSEGAPTGGAALSALLWSAAPNLDAGAAHTRRSGAVDANAPTPRVEVARPRSKRGVKEVSARRQRPSCVAWRARCSIASWLRATKLMVGFLTRVFVLY